MERTVLPEVTVARAALVAQEVLEALREREVQVTREVSLVQMEQRLVLVEVSSKIIHTQQEMLPQRVVRLVLQVREDRAVPAVVVQLLPPQREVPVVPLLELVVLPMLVVLLQTMERPELY
jgi:DNA-binding LacI/PurR family transcriptional regulator